MEIFIRLLIITAAGYLIGSLSTSIFMSRLLGRDVRKMGSGNAGATNMARVFGFGFGLLTLLGDVVKAVVAMVLGRLLLGDTGIAVGGIAVLVGHCFPVFHHFQGGKGVSIGAAIAGAVDWRVLVAVVCAFFAGALLTKKVSVGSICAAVSITIAAAIVGVSAPKMALCVCGMCLVVFQHRQNIRRILDGTEPDFQAAKKLPSFCRRKKKKQEKQDI